MESSFFIFFSFVSFFVRILNIFLLQSLVINAVVVGVVVVEARGEGREGLVVMAQHNNRTDVAVAKTGIYSNGHRTRAFFGNLFLLWTFGCLIKILSSCALPISHRIICLN